MIGSKGSRIMAISIVRMLVPILKKDFEKLFSKQFFQNILFQDKQTTSQITQRAELKIGSILVVVISSAFGNYYHTHTCIHQSMAWLANLSMISFSRRQKMTNDYLIKGDGRLNTLSSLDSSDNPRTSSENRQILIPIVLINVC